MYLMMMSFVHNQMLIIEKIIVKQATIEVDWERRSTILWGFVIQFQCLRCIASVCGN